jgi:DNA invertase Pin-like site-specific DNA recombinase
MLIGYARVSTPEQDLTPQLDALREAGCERTFSDKASGAKANRVGLADALSHARPGDVLVVWKLDRLGRTMKGLVDLAADLAERGVGFRSLTDGIDTAGTAGKLVFHIMAAMAEMERDGNDAKAAGGGSQTSGIRYDHSRDCAEHRRFCSYPLSPSARTGAGSDQRGRN